MKSFVRGMEPNCIESMALSTFAIERPVGPMKMFDLTFVRFYPAAPLVISDIFSFFRIAKRASVSTDRARGYPLFYLCSFFTVVR